MIDLHELDGRAVDLDEGDMYPGAWAIQLDYHVLPFQRLYEIVHLESDVRHSLDQLWVWGIVPVALPLDAEGIVEVIADSHLQVGKRDLALEGLRCWDADVVVLHVACTLRARLLVGVVPGSVLAAADVGQLARVARQWDRARVVVEAPAAPACLPG